MSKLSKIASRGLKMLSWSQEALKPTLKIGDTVKVIASRELLDIIDINEPMRGIEGVVDTIDRDPNDSWADERFPIREKYFGTIQVVFLKGTDQEYSWLFPYSNWQKFLEKIYKTTLAWSQEALDKDREYDFEGFLKKLGPRQIWIVHRKQYPDVKYLYIGEYTAVYERPVPWGDGTSFNITNAIYNSQIDASHLTVTTPAVVEPGMAPFILIKDTNSEMPLSDKLSWSQEALRDDIQVGDTVEVIATPVLLESIALHEDFFTRFRAGNIGKVKSIDKTDQYTFGMPSDDYIGDIVIPFTHRDEPGKIRYYHFPYSHWKKFLEKVIDTGSTASLKFSQEKPSEEQLEAGNYKKKHIRKDGFDISIENDKGSTRSGTDKDGKEWSVKMKHAYGYIKGTEGKDGDHVDVILADDYKEGQSVFIVNQTDDKGTFDEHKVCIGFIGKDDAEKAYLDNYEKGWKNYDDIIEMPMEQFKEWVRDKKYTKNLAKPLKLSWLQNWELVGRGYIHHLKVGSRVRVPRGTPESARSWGFGHSPDYSPEKYPALVLGTDTRFPRNAAVPELHEGTIVYIATPYVGIEWDGFPLSKPEDPQGYQWYLREHPIEVQKSVDTESSLKLGWKIHPKTIYTREEFLEAVGPNQVWVLTSDTGYTHVPFRTLDKAAFIGLDDLGRPKITDSYFQTLHMNREYESGNMPFDYAVINKMFVTFGLISGTPKTSSLKLGWQQFQWQTVDNVKVLKVGDRVRIPEGVSVGSRSWGFGNAYDYTPEKYPSLRIGEEGRLRDSATVPELGEGTVVLVEGASILRIVWDGFPEMPSKLIENRGWVWSNYDFKIEALLPLDYKTKLSWKQPDLKVHLQPGAVFKMQFFGSTRYQFFYFKSLKPPIKNYFRTTFPEATPENWSHDSDLMPYDGIHTQDPDGLEKLLHYYQEGYYKYDLGIFLSQGWQDGMEYLGQIEDVVAENKRGASLKFSWKVQPRTVFVEDDAERKRLAGKYIVLVLDYENEEYETSYEVKAGLFDRDGFFSYNKYDNDYTYGTYKDYEKASSVANALALQNNGVRMLLRYEVEDNQPRYSWQFPTAPKRIRWYDTKARELAIGKDLVAVFRRFDTFEVGIARLSAHDWLSQVSLIQSDIEELDEASKIADAYALDHGLTRIVARDEPGYDDISKMSWQFIKAYIPKPLENCPEGYRRYTAYLTYPPGMLGEDTGVVEEFDIYAIHMDAAEDFAKEYAKEEYIEGYSRVDVEPAFGISSSLKLAWQRQPDADDDDQQEADDILRINHFIQVIVYNGDTVTRSDIEVYLNRRITDAEWSDVLGYIEDLKDDMRDVEASLKFSWNLFRDYRQFDYNQYKEEKFKPSPEMYRKYHIPIGALIEIRGKSGSAPKDTDDYELTSIHGYVVGSDTYDTIFIKPEDFFTMFEKVEDTKESSLKLGEQQPLPPTGLKPAIVKHPEYYNFTPNPDHPWQMHLYEQVLQEQQPDVDYVEPEHITREEAALIHTPKYLDTVFAPPNTKQRTVAWEGGPWDQSAQNAVFRSAGGTIKANQEALTRGMSVQLYDAFHHAYPDHGEGFCVLNDVAIAAKKLSNEGKRVMVVDTDVHQGQGTANCTQGDPNIYTLSTHAHYIYPFPRSSWGRASEHSSQDIELDPKIEDDVYLKMLQDGLIKAIEEFGKPDLVMYIAGTDLYGDDRLSDTKITIDGIRQRDKLVYDFFGKVGVPIATSIPQGYARNPADSKQMISNTIKEMIGAHNMYYRGTAPKQSITSSKGLRIVSWKVIKQEILVGWDNVVNYWKQPGSNPVVVSLIKSFMNIRVGIWYPHMKDHTEALGDVVFEEHQKTLNELGIVYNAYKDSEKTFTVAEAKDALNYANELSSKYNTAPFYILDASSANKTKEASDRWAQEVLSLM